jgi:peroxidase
MPNARTLSMQLFGTRNVTDPKHSLGFMSFGQFVTHDLGSIVDKTEFEIFNLCCDGDGQYMYCDPNQKQCATVDLPSGDPFFFSNMSCMDVIRSTDNRDIGCQSKSKSVEQVNTVSAFADLSIVYGSSVDENRQIRSFSDGKLLVNTNFGIDWPKQDTTGLCPNTGESCFHFGDHRGNQNAGLTLFQLYFFQEHNRLATQLKTINSNWDDEKLFQEARRINIAQYQHIIYYEYLPLLMGKRNLVDKKIMYPLQRGYISDYVPIDPSTLNEFSAGAFRIFHTQIETVLQ